MTELRRMKMGVEVGVFFYFFININNVGPTHSEKYCHTSMPRQQKILFPPPRQRLMVNVGQYKQCTLYCTNIYSSHPELNPKIHFTPMCSWRNCLDPFLHLYPFFYFIYLLLHTMIIKKIVSYF